MSAQDKFEAAVNVIRSLPKSGSYQPSNEVMLKFYSYFKQATEGKCNIKKPAFWDVVSRAKWDAWNKLGDMSSAKAMEEYVVELQKIVETMAYTDNVAAFYDTAEDSLPSSMSKDDLELVAGDILRKFKSSSSSTESSQDNSPLRSMPEQNGHYESDDEFIDTIESEEFEVPLSQVNLNGHIPNGHAVQINGHAVQTNGHAVQMTVVHPELVVHNRANDKSTFIIEELKRTVGCLEKDVAILKERFQKMDKEKSKQDKSLLWMKPSWWPMRRVSPAILIGFFLWPIVANQMIALIRRKRRT